MIGCSAGGAALSTLTPSASERRSGKWTRAWRICGSVIANAIGYRFAVRAGRDLTFSGFNPSVSAPRADAIPGKLPIEAEPGDSVDAH